MNPIAFPPIYNMEIYIIKIRTTTTDSRPYVGNQITSYKTMVDSFFFLVTKRTIFFNNHPIFLSLPIVRSILREKFPRK